VKDKGNVVNIPGMAPFRTPAEIDITHVKLPIVISTLHNCGITDFEIISKKETEVKKEVEVKETKKHKIPKVKDKNLEERFTRLEKILSKLMNNQESKKSLSEEQITNKLAILEELSKKILEREMVKQVVYTSAKDNSKNPVIEELDEEIYIPDVDISDLKIKGSSSQTVGEVDDVEEAADILSRLKK